MHVWDCKGRGFCAVARVMWDVDCGITRCTRWMLRSFFNLFKCVLSMHSLSTWYTCIIAVWMLCPLKLILFTVVIKSHQQPATVTDKVRNRLEQLDDFEEVQALQMPLKHTPEIIWTIPFTVIDMQNHCNSKRFSFLASIYIQQVFNCVDLLPYELHVGVHVVRYVPKFWHSAYWLLAVSSIEIFCLDILWSVSIFAVFFYLFTRVTLFRLHWFTKYFQAFS